jgi:signal transduction histidine kinase
MLHDFLIANRGEILDRSRTKLATRAAPTPTESELAEGLPLFLDQLVAILRAQKDNRGDGRRQVSESAKRERVSVAEFIEEIEIVATIDAKGRDIQLSIDAGPYAAAVEGDHQILASVVANLVQNAFKFTRPHGHISVRARATDERVLIDVEDECGGLPPGKAEDLFRPFEQRSVDRTGMGLGLSISLRIPVDLGGRSGVIWARVPVDLGAVGAKRRALSGVGAKRRVEAHAEG